MIGISVMKELKVSYYNWMTTFPLMKMIADLKGINFANF